MIAALDNLTPVQRIAKQIQEKDTPSKKQARDKNLLREAFKEAQIQHGKRLYPYKLNYVEFFKDVSNILKERSEGSQFLMVSLKDSVVEKAKLIYGVFPKNGVSHVVKYKDKTMPSITN